MANSKITDGVGSMVIPAAAWKNYKEAVDELRAAEESGSLEAVLKAARALTDAFDRIERESEESNQHS